MKIKDYKEGRDFLDLVEINFDFGKKDILLDMISSRLAAVGMMKKVGVGNFGERMGQCFVNRLRNQNGLKKEIRIMVRMSEKGELEKE